jgi:hypothetical protein
VNLGLSGVGVIGARYGFYLDAGAVLAESNIAAGWDVVATIVDTSAGGTWSSGINFSGANASCATPATTWGEPNGGNQPCFNLGANGELTLMNFLSQGANGSFIVTAGSNVSLRNTDNRIVGGILDGGDYAQIKITGGNPGITVQNGLFGGTANTTNNQHLHVHGIVATGHTPSGLVMTDNTFLYQTDVLVSDFSASTMISGNVSAFTAGASSIILTGLGSGLGKNTWDKPPVPTIESGFGTAPAMTVGADFLTFLVDTGTGATRNNGVVDIPVAAPVGYVCSAVNQSNSVGSAPVVTAATNHSVVLSNYSRTTGIGLNWSDHDRVAVQCRGF